MSRKVLVVDDEKLIVKGIRFSLEQDGMEVDCAYDGEEALEKAKENKYDIILLDLMLPKMDGFEVCQQIREFSNVPIVMLTAKGEDMDKILGLEYGADDYITKPFDIREVVTRIRVALRRREEIKRISAIKEDSEIIINNVKIDEGCRSVYIDNVEVQLKPKEFDLLLFLSKNSNKVFSRDQLLDLVWGYDFIGDTRTIDVHVTRIRKKLGNSLNIETVFGVGYILKVKHGND